MALYFIVGIISAFFMYLANNKTKNKTIKRFFIVMSFLPFFCILAFRYGIGYDYLNIYDKIFRMVVTGGSTTWEPGITWLIKIIGHYSHDSFYFFFITALVTSIFTYKGILKNSDKPWFSLLLFIISGLYMDSMNAVRQYIAIAIFAYSLKFIIEKDFKKYLIWIIIASLFHSSVLIMIPVYFFCQKQLTWKKRIIVFFILIMMFPFINSLFINIISKTKYSFYLTSVYDSANPTYSELIISSFLFLISSFLYKKGKNNEKFNIFYNLTFLFLIVGLLSFKVLLAYRIIMYFKISIIFMVPSIIGLINKQKNKIIFYLLFITMFSGITLIGAYKFGWYDTKYVSIFEKWSN